MFKRIFLTLIFLSLFNTSVLAQTAKTAPTPPQLTATPAPPADPEEQLEEEATGDDINTIRQNNQDDEERSQLLGDLPCLDATQTCINQLQLKAIDTKLQSEVVE